MKGLCSSGRKSMGLIIGLTLGSIRSCQDRSCSKCMEVQYFILKQE